MVESPENQQPAAPMSTSAFPVLSWAAEHPKRWHDIGKLPETLKAAELFDPLSRPRTHLVQELPQARDGCFLTTICAARPTESDRLPPHGWRSPANSPFRPVAVSREWLLWSTATADIGPPLPPHFCNRSHVPASLNTHSCRQYLRFKVMSLNDFALSFPQRLGADPAASLVCGLHLKFTPSSSPTISRALRRQNL